MAGRTCLSIPFLVLCIALSFTNAALQPEYPMFETLSNIKLSQSRGYVDVLIAIGESVQEDMTLIDRLQQVFTEFSSVLHRVTDKYGSGVHLEEVNILIPDSWSDDERYESSSGESFAASDIRIDRSNDERSPNSNQPYTHKATACGSPGQYIRLTPDYITNDRIARLYGDRSKTLVHEWAHFRWGVFDEYPLPGDDHFYAASNGQFEATKCVAAIQGIKATPDGKECNFTADGAPDENCRFFDGRDASETYEASLMYKQFLPEMRSFCDSDFTNSNPSTTHNAEAPNQQNRQCSSKSIWEILREHRDFPRQTAVSDSSPNGLPQRNLVPTFRLIKRSITRAPIILVLDTSGSMTTLQRLHILRQASYNLITRVLSDDQIFSAVSFSDTATIRITASPVGSDREILTSQLPITATGGTSIGSGVRLGIQNLDDTVEDYAGTQMIVLTDGDENKPPYLAELTTSELSGITIHTVAIGSNADDSLEELANRTNGRTFQQTDESAALFNIFTRLAVQDNSDVVEIFSESFNITNRTRTFSLDSTSGGQITILVGFPESHLTHIDVQVLKPNGDVIDKNSTLPDRFLSVPDFDLIQIDSEVIEGDWEIRVISYMDSDLMATMHVETTRLDPSFQALPIEIDAGWALAEVEPSEIQTLQVTVNQGYTPISNADVKVKVFDPNGLEVSLPMFDDGVGSDVRANDGVYSAFFTRFNGEGRYSLQVSVNGINGVTKLMEGTFVGQGPAAADPELIRESNGVAVNTGSFERSIEGNSFRCEGVEQCSGTSDMYSPFRITDLRGYTIKENATVVLKFTAPGDDLFDGTASYYEIHIATNVTDLLNQFNETEILEYIPPNQVTNETEPPYVISGNLSTPLPARSTEIFLVQLPTEGGEFNYIFSVVAVDDMGQESQPSNFATVTANLEIISETIMPSIPGIPAAIIFGTLLPLLTLLLLLLLLLLFLKKRRTSKVKDNESSPPIKSEPEPLSEPQQVVVIENNEKLQHGIVTENNTVRYNAQTSIMSELARRQQVTQRNQAPIMGQIEQHPNEQRESDIIVNGAYGYTEGTRQSDTFVSANIDSSGNVDSAYNFLPVVTPQPEIVRTATRQNQPEESNYPMIRVNTSQERTRTAEKVYASSSSQFAIDNPVFENDDYQPDLDSLSRRPVPLPSALTNPPPSHNNHTESDDDANDYDFVANPNSQNSHVLDMMQTDPPVRGEMNFQSELANAISQSRPGARPTPAVRSRQSPLTPTNVTPSVLPRQRDNQSRPPVDEDSDKDIYDEPPKAGNIGSTNGDSDSDSYDYDEPPRSGNLRNTDGDDDSDADDYVNVVDRDRLKPMGLD